MRVQVGDVRLFFETYGAEWVLDGDRMRRRPVVLALHGGPGTDATGLRCALAPLAGTQTIKLVMARLADADPPRYASYRLGVPYADGTRQACDVCLDGPEPWGWAMEVKMLRIMGDKGKLNDNMVMHILSPYPAHRSALTDCTKLVASQLGTHKAILIYGYDYPGWPMDPAIEAFQVLASQQVLLADSAMASLDGLIHPVHRRGRVFGWQIQPLDD